jgi:hypothetical protein
MEINSIQIAIHGSTLVIWIDSKGYRVPAANLNDRTS